MIIVLKKIQGKVAQEFIKTINELEDGRYLVNVRSLSDTSISALRKRYFVYCETVGNHEGSSKQVIHERAKRKAGITSTRDFDVEQWMNYLDTFREEAFFNHEIVL